MSNNFISSNSITKNPDILDFLDRVRKQKILSNISNFDILDTVKVFYGTKPTMSKSVKKKKQSQPFNSLTLSRISTMARDLKSNFINQPIIN